MFTKKEIEELKQIVKKVTGREITDEEACDQGTRIIQLFELFQRQERLDKQKELLVDQPEEPPQDSNH